MKRFFANSLSSLLVRVFFCVLMSVFDCKGMISYNPETQCLRQEIVCPKSYFLRFKNEYVPVCFRLSKIKKIELFVPFEYFHRLVQNLEQNVVMRSNQKKLTERYLLFPSLAQCSSDYTQRFDNHNVGANKKGIATLQSEIEALSYELEQANKNLQNDLDANQRAFAQAIKKLNVRIMNCEVQNQNLSKYCMSLKKMVTQVVTQKKQLALFVQEAKAMLERIRCYNQLVQKIDNLLSGEQNISQELAALRTELTNLAQKLKSKKQRKDESVLVHWLSLIFLLGTISEGFNIFFDQVLSRFHLTAYNNQYTRFLLLGSVSGSLFAYNSSFFSKYKKK